MRPDLYAQRLAVLLEAHHRREQPAMTSEELAHQVSLVTRSVVPAVIVDEALAGTALPPDEVTQAIVQVLDSEDVLFTDSPEGADLEHRLRVCAIVRDRYRDGGTNIIARGTSLSPRQTRELLAFLEDEPTSPAL
ncbi:MULTISPECIES: hypothetical protein [Gordonia]|jgi:hypothetical protein|uniref:Uncharacterized protein n=1 Tax=Gordonia sihwensis NBRC 108236 TaxID=1223544 RepID=L7LMI8_9ACTN|nr:MULTISPECIES: hypothetical protein [Gordonia]WFN95166.1 hypothetical protein P5P27_20590 [Gordonia sihwensis]GAC62355.1 hypothetical protein GSI01S_33_00410 [Gordonia sihwensis NBRC 108236]